MNLPMARSKVYRNSFLFKGLRDFQLLPNEIKSEQHKLKFIKKMQIRTLEISTLSTNSSHITPISITTATNEIFKVLTIFIINVQNVIRPY